MEEAFFQAPGLITVDASRQEEIDADHVYLFVTVKGSSLVTGGAALHKAREVAQLVAELGAIGIGQDQIRLQSVQAETATGTLLKTSQASYQLKIHCPKLELLADILGIVTALKNSRLDSLEWGYPDLEDYQNKLLGLAIGVADKKARQIASALGVTLLGVYRFTETRSDTESPRALKHAYAGTAPESMARRMTADDLGLEVSHTKRISAYVKIEYRISGFNNATL